MRTRQNFMFIYMFNTIDSIGFHVIKTIVKQFDKQLYKAKLNNRARVAQQEVHSQLTHTHKKKTQV